MAPVAKPGHEFLKFVNVSPTPYHAVQSIREKLAQAGFEQIHERNDWANTCKPGGKYYLTRNASTLLAFAIGEEWRPGGPIAMIGAHTDSPCLRIKPFSKHQVEGFLQVAVETYGGGLWHTWFDRDLSAAGRVMVKTNAGFVHKLVNLHKPFLRIPSLAIHLDRQEKFEFSKESQLFPIAGLVAAELERQGVTTPPDSASEGGSEPDFAPIKAMKERHHPHLIELIAEAAKVSSDQIEDFELVLYDTQKSCVGGFNDELIFSPRLDNLEMTFCSAEALIESTRTSGSLKNDNSIRLISLFDHEEIGSTSAQGAQSNLLPTVIRRLAVLPSSKKANISATAYEQSLATSFLISADMAHSVHPNYIGKYEARHHPVLNQGTVIKINANQRYTTNAPGMVLLQEVARRAQVPLQVFVVSNGRILYVMKIEGGAYNIPESPCGSTIGPMLSAKLGVRTLDLGNPQLSMHSIRETGGVYDVDYAIKLFRSFFEHYGELESKVLVDNADEAKI